MGLDQENRGLTLRIQDPATMPLRPSGLRFMHIAAAGFTFAVALPLGLIFLLVRFDNPEAAYKALLAAGIVVRDMRHALGLGDALRISLGTREQNDAVLATLAGQETVA